MSTNTNTPVPMRYFQARREVTRDFGISNFPETRPAGPLPARITERALFTPDSQTYCCESTPSLWVEVLGYEAEWDEEVSDELREWWDTELYDVRSNDDDYYVHYSRVVAHVIVLGGFTFTDWFTTVHEDGEFDSLDDAREYAQGNWHV